jgi:hypothetical protein
VDILVEDVVIVELKAAEALIPLSTPPSPILI